MDVDAALHQAGEYGKLQRRVLWTMAIPQIFVAWQHILNAFVGAEPRLFCIRGEEQSEGCQGEGQPPCDRYVMPGQDFTSIASEWSLVCSQSYKSDVVQSVYMAGLLVGNLVGGFVADQYGRRRLVYASALGITALSGLAACAQTYESYVALQFLSAVSAGAYGLVSFTLPTELVGAGQRGLVNVTMTISYALGIGSLSAVAYVIRDWRALSIVTALPGLIGIYYYRVVPESPRWLFSQGRVEEAESALTYITLFNSGGRPPPHPIKLMPPPLPSAGAMAAAGSGSIFDLVRNAALRRITVNNVYTWFVISMVYYGLTLRAGTLGSDRYVSISLAGLIEIPADFATLWSMDRYGRRSTYSCGLLAGGLACVSIALLPQGLTQQATLLAFVGKMGISMSFCVCWIHAAEMYPTTIRNKALSVCNMSSRFGGVVSPLVLTLGKLHHNVDFLLFGACALLAGAVSRALPETRNRPLPENISDIDGGGRTMARGATGGQSSPLGQNEGIGGVTK